MDSLVPITDHIRFRCWRPDDATLAVALWGDPRVTGLIADLGNPSEQQALDRLELERRNQDLHGISYWPIFRPDGEHLGCCGLRPYSPVEKIFEVGVHLRPAHWGRGHASEAMRAVCDHAFNHLRAGGLFARRHPQNHGSARLLGRVGFQFTHLEFMPQTGLSHPCYLLRRG